MRARTLPGRTVALLLLAVLVSACRGAGPAPAPAQTPPPPDPAEPEPVSLVVEHIEMAPMGNDEILTGQGATADAEVAEEAVRTTRRALERYLTDQFTSPRTRFTPEPARTLLRPGLFDTLTPEQRHALGHLTMPARGVITGPARGSATVLFDGEQVYAVALEYRASFRLVLWDDSEAPVTQHGSVVFTAPDWGVESFELTVDAPPAPPPSPSPPASPSATAGPSETAS